QPINELSDAYRASGAEDGGPEVQFRVADAANPQICEQGLRDQTEALSSSWERSDHRGGGDENHKPSVVQTGRPCGTGISKRRGGTHIGAILPPRSPGLRCRVLGALLHGAARYRCRVLGASLRVLGPAA